MEGAYRRFRRWLHAGLFRAITTARGEGALQRYLSELEARQFASESDVAARQRALVEEALVRAHASVPYYQRIFREVLRGRVPTAEDLLHLPFLSKSLLQSEFDSLAAVPLSSRVTRKTTGGSTGQAVTVLKDRDALAHEMAATWLAYGWHGVHIGDPYARFWGSPTTTKRWLRSTAASVATRRINFSAFAFGEIDLELYWQRSKRFKPAFFYGYVSMIEAFAEFVIRRGYDGRSLGLKAVITTSEVLGAPQRALIERAFGAPVQNEYGCGEVGPIAYECERGMLHTVADNLFVELIREDGQPAEVGEAGEVVVTDLHNRAMPLIRYRVGDFAIRGGPCACGRGWPTFEKVWGRAYDFILGPDGRRYHGEYVMYLFEDLRERGTPVSQFQVEQVDARTLEVRIVCDTGRLDATRASLLRTFSERLPGLNVSVQACEAIPRSASGKMRIILNQWAEANRS